MNENISTNKIQHWYLHVDLDAFFASVEQLDHPQYRGKPVIVGGKPEDRRGVVSTASYEARKFGVHSAMPTAQAYKLCPQGIFVHGRMERYQELSYHIMNIFRKYSPDVDQMSIDEAFIDLTGTEKLWGSPEETALKIKQEVKEETGLTVSIGLAASKYIAKIASGYSKPDGFHFVQPGKETEFMLSLPLSKVWGAGEKTQEVMINHGIKTTRDLYNTDLQLLEFIFGKNSANFLYNAVRGQEFESFNKTKTKNHSISTERTFGYDIYDSYVAETYLLELSHYVVFRLLKEGGFSRTIFLKIRYEDFSTTSIQQTFDAPILTVDSYYDAIIQLFNRKFQKGRGIRLLGVGFDNIEKEDRCHQYSLFEEPDEKKQKIEQAILNLENKHPEIKIHKARLLNNSVKALFLSLFLLLPFSNKASAQDFIPVVTDKTPLSLYNWNINDKEHVDFLVSGYWLMALEYSAKANLGKNFAITSTPPIFKQEVELYTWLMLDNRFYFEADFADEFHKNTFALGYEGNGTLKSARISNRKITMPTYYSAQAFGFGLGGGNNQAPGISFHFEDTVNSKWSGDFLLRYDMTKTQTATFYGNNQVVDTYISLENFQYGRAFVFPQEAKDFLQNIEAVYVESKNGSYKDKNNRSYEKLSQNQYTYFASSGKLAFSESANTGKTNGKIPGILITFTDSSAVSEIIKSAGDYEDSQSFCGKIQDYFNQTKTFDLEKYSYSLNNTINDSEALVIQNSYGFSPFIVANSYNIGISTNTDVYIVSKSSESIKNEFITYYDNEGISDFASETENSNHLYYIVQKSNSQDDSLQNPENRFPFADINPEVYLNLKSDTDNCILSRAYNSVSEFNIGTDASKSTVQVYINGTLDSSAEYDEKTGVVTTKKSINQTDKIYIVWQEDSTEPGSGSLVTGLGFVYNFLPELTGDYSINFRWPMNPHSNYSTIDNPQEGFGAFSTGITYKKAFEHSSLELSNKSAIAFQTENPTGTLLVKSQNDNSLETFYLSKNSGYVTKTIPIINLESNQLVLSESARGTIENHNGINDSSISGYRIPLSWDFSSSELKPWASVDIKLDNGTSLKSTSIFEFAFLPALEDSDLTNYKVYLQLGICTDKDEAIQDNSDLPVWELTEISNKTISNLDLSKKEWQTVSVLLDDYDRSKLVSNWDARIIIVGEEFQEKSKGTLYAGPYEPHEQNIFVKSDDEVSVYTDVQLSSAPSSKALYSTKSYESKINWIIDSPDLLINQDQTKLYASTYFTKAGFSSYDSINFDFAIVSDKQEEFDLFTETEPGFSFILDKDGNSISDTGEIAVQLDFYNIDSYINPQIVYHSVSLNLKDNSVSIDNLVLDKVDYNLYINKSVVPNREKLILNTIQKDYLITKGALYLSNLYYTGSKAYYSGQNKISADYEYKDSLAKLHVESNQKLALTTPEEKLSVDSKQITATANGEINVTNINIKSDADLAYSSDSPDSSVINLLSHSFETKNNLLKTIGFSENYTFYKANENLKKADTLSLDFTNLKIPVIISSEFAGSQTKETQIQSGKLESKINLKVKEYTGNITGTVTSNQKIMEATDPNSFIDLNNYFLNWYEISKLEFSKGRTEASIRSLDYNFKSSNAFPFAKFSPALEYDLQSVYQASSTNNFTDTTKLILKLPVSFNKNSYYINYSRIGVGLQPVVTQNYLTDTNELFGLINQRNWFYNKIPVYELFDRQSGNTLLYINQNSLSDYLLYNSKYEAGWKRKLFNTYLDLFVPSSTVLSISREQKVADTLSDLYLFKATMTQTALNCFGSKSQLKFFNWYEQEEILSTLSGSIKFPADFLSKPVIQIDTYSQIILFFKETNNLKNAMSFMIDNNLDWNLKNSTVWSRKTDDCILLPLVKKVLPEDKNAKFQITRKETFNMDFENKNKINKQKYEYLHSLDVNFLSYYYLSVGLGTEYSHTQDSVDSLGITATVSGKMEF